MKKSMIYLFMAMLSLLLVNCNSSKNTTNLKATRGNLAGTWTISDIAVNMPENYKVTNVFDEAPYSDFKGSTWDLVRNGNGTYTLASGTKRDINWSLHTKGGVEEFQFKKLMGEKARNVDEGYRLSLGEINRDHFVVQSIISADNGITGTITYTFTRK